MSRLVIATAGHIDHGKSALVHALTGTDPDRLAEEKARGITIDLGFAHLATPTARLAFVDVPGHERFVHNMLAGASGVDAVLLVIAADESVMPQTREHLAICSLLGVPTGVVAITKVDTADRDTRAVARLEAASLISGTFLERAPVVEVSARTGEGLDDLVRALEGVVSRKPARAVDGLVRLPVDRVFTIKGFGTVVTGTLVSGRIAPEDELVLLPARRRVKVRGVQVHGVHVAHADAGERTAVNLQGLERQQSQRGDVLAHPDAGSVTRVLDAAIDILADVRPLVHDQRVRFHLGTDEVGGRVSLGVNVAADCRLFARIRLDRPTVATRGDRFVLRSPSPASTIGGGVVLDPLPPHGPTRTAAACARFEALAVGKTTESRLDVARRVLSRLLDEAGVVGVLTVSLTSRVGLTPAAAVEAERDALERGRAVRTGSRLVATQVVGQLGEGLESTLTRHHRDEPLSGGMPREDARSRLPGHPDPLVFELVVEGLRQAGRVVGSERLSLATHADATVADGESALLRKVEDAARAPGLRAPTEAELAGETGIPAASVGRLVGRLAREQKLVRLGDLIFHREAIDALTDDLRRLAAETASDVRIDVGWFKERYGVTRKFAIPILEHLDRQRVTRRVGDTRVIVSGAKV
jgi:selenocysteine-specific elongation factor